MQAGSIRLLRRATSIVLAARRGKKGNTMASAMTIEIARRLELLHDEYRDRVNAALDEGREDIARRISEEHTQRATRVVADLV